jgi:hypothetical protein
MAKHKYIETPEKMWQLFEEYKAHVKENPRMKVEYVGRDGSKVQTPLETPLTIEGFENYVADQGVIQDLGDYFANSNNKYNEYSTICSRIRRRIRQDQIEGGMVGQYNASITQRLNNLKEQTETTSTNVNLLNIDPLSD